MAQKWNKSEIEDAALVLTVSDTGEYKWSSNKSREQVADMLVGIAGSIRRGEDK